MHLALASSNSQWIKGDIFQNCKGLVVSIKNIHVLFKQSFYHAPLGNEDLKRYTLQCGDFIY